MRAACVVRRAARNAAISNRAIATFDETELVEGVRVPVVRALRRGVEVAHRHDARQATFTFARPRGSSYRRSAPSHGRIALE